MLANACAAYRPRIHDTHFLGSMFLIVTGGFSHTLTGPHLTGLQTGVREAKRGVLKHKVFDEKANSVLVCRNFPEIIRVPERFLAKPDLSFYHILALTAVMARRINNASLTFRKLPTNTEKWDFCIHQRYANGSIEILFKNW